MSKHCVHGVWCAAQVFFKNSMCCAQLCSHSPCPHPTPDLVPLRLKLLQQLLLSSPLCLQHLLLSPQWVHTIDPLDSPESRSVVVGYQHDSTREPIQLVNDSTHASFFVHIISSVHASSHWLSVHFVLCKSFSTTQGHKSRWDSSNASTYL